MADARDRDRVPPGMDDQVLETSRLILELIHAGYTKASPTLTTRGEPPAHGEGLQGVRLSRQGLRAAIELYQRGELTMGELASNLGVSRGWASRVVEELESVRLAERATDPHDRRVVRVRLASSASEVVGRAYRWRGEAIERALAGLDETERRAVRLFLSRVIDELAADDAELELRPASDGGATQGK